MSGVNGLYFKSIAIVAHDAGAANLIGSWINRNYIRTKEFRLCVQGPARSILFNALPNVSEMDIDLALNGAEVLISGTGWQSDLEHDARKLAKSKKISSIAVLDHWTNYQARFIRNGREVLPDELWVTDKYGLQIARDTFSSVPVKLRRNDYLEDQVEKIKTVNRHDSSTIEILFLMEPIRSKWGEVGIPGEIQALRYLIENMQLLGFRGNSKITVRPHPSDPKGKYEYWNSFYSWRQVSVNSNDTLSSLISAAEVVVGCQTYAMVVALAAGKKVISALPRSAPSCVLPHREIIHLTELAAENEVL